MRFQHLSMRFEHHRVAKIYKLSSQNVYQILLGTQNFFLWSHSGWKCTKRLHSDRVRVTDWRDVDVYGSQTGETSTVRTVYGSGSQTGETSTVYYLFWWCATTLAAAEHCACKISGVGLGRV